MRRLVFWTRFFELSLIWPTWLVRCRSESHSRQQCHFAWSRVVASSGIASFRSGTQSRSDEEGPRSTCCYSWYSWGPNFEVAGKKGIYYAYSACSREYLFSISSKFSPTVVWVKVPEARLAVSIFLLVLFWAWCNCSRTLLGLSVEELGKFYCSLLWLILTLLQPIFSDSTPLVTGSKISPSITQTFTVYKTVIKDQTIDWAIFPY